MAVTEHLKPTRKFELLTCRLQNRLLYQLSYVGLNEPDIDNDLVGIILNSQIFVNLKQNKLDCYATGS